MSESTGFMNFRKLWNTITKIKFNILIIYKFIIKKTRFKAYAKSRKIVYVALNINNKF
jgi:hypothetical protein